MHINTLLIIIYLIAGATPQSIMSTALPGLLHSVKQMDSVSRFYARQGFLGLLFTKVNVFCVLIALSAKSCIGPLRLIQ